MSEGVRNRKTAEGGSKRDLRSECEDLSRLMGRPRVRGISLAIPQIRHRFRSQGEKMAKKARTSKLHDGDDKDERWMMRNSILR